MVPLHAEGASETGMNAVGPLAMTSVSIGDRVRLSPSGERVVKKLRVRRRYGTIWAVRADHVTVVWDGTRTPVPWSLEYLERA